MTNIPKRIEVYRSERLIGYGVPGSVWRQPPFPFSPQPFTTESEGLHQRILPEDVQIDSLSRFLRDPLKPIIYGVSGRPDDSKAKYFAAYLMDVHAKAIQTNQLVRPVWEPLYGGFDNKLKNEHQAGLIKPSLLVLSNLTPNSTSVKLEKARDLLEYFSDIPRIVVVAGEDPISFLSTRLYVPVNAIAQFAEKSVKQKIEVI